MWEQGSLDVVQNVISSACYPNLADPTRPLGYDPIPIWNSYWTAIGQSRFRSGLGSTCQLLKRLSTTMISIGRLFALLSAEDD
jgi:hypothetical protein